MRTAAGPVKSVPAPPAAEKRGRFKDKEEYLAWAEQRKKKLLHRAAVKAALKEKVRSFFRAKSFLRKKFIIFSASIVGIALFFSLPSMKSAKVDPRAGEGIRAPEQGETILSPPASEVSKKTNQEAGKNLYSLEDLLPRARKVVVLIKSRQGSGSGFLLPYPGFVATCAHLLGRSDEVEVYLPNGAVKKGVVLKRLPMPLDVAFIQVEDFGMDWAPLADSDHCQDGEEAVAVGVPGSDQWRPDLVMVKGKILQCHKPYQGVQYLQMSRDIHPAAIGGPIFNARGEILGISRGELTGNGFEGTRYGLAINVVKGLIDQRLSHLEERTREREQFYKYVYDDLWKALSAEHQAYQKKLSDLHVKGRLSPPEAARLENKGLQPPAGYSSMKNWMADLTEKVMRGELTKEKAAAQIQSHYEL